MKRDREKSEKDRECLSCPGVEQRWVSTFEGEGI